MIEVGKKAPAITLLDGNGNKRTLKEFEGKKIVLYFYPKDDTSGCTAEACDFRDSFPKFNKTKAEIIGVSPDSVASHKKFAEKYELPFILLSDEEKKVVEKYGVWKEKSMYGKKYMGVERTTVLIDGKGIIRKIYPKVKVSGHVDEVTKDLEAI
ncbi:MAG: thioredoxin-dependent thiol peroxidase [Ignavibacteriales bacterium]|nr:thioredoxin-dependent thiol peroxidase [Ignavibacteriales bacterium]MCB9218624.1 thioredoxin-dependent thiol peroxidase [Ignavibacteriales bacterium]MCB9259370.1 thioredoxin-dependent thiol peroxidase [Ignavibacteriales bacterium]